MSITGNGQEARQQEVEALLRQKNPIPATGAMPAPVAGDGTLMGLALRLAERCRSRADTLATSADEDKKQAYEFAAVVLEGCQKWGSELLARKRREVAELEQFMGKLGGNK